MDGLDPSSGLLAAAQAKGLYQNTFCGYVTPDEKTPIEDDAYDVLLCSAGMFPGSIVPQVIRGMELWNLCPGLHGAPEGGEAGRPDRLEHRRRIRGIQRVLPNLRPDLPAAHPGGQVGGGAASEEA